MKQFELADFRKVDCRIWKDNPAELMMIHKVTDKKPCDGCAFYNSGACKGYIKLDEMTR